MALTTRSAVLQRVGLTDDVTAAPAVAFSYSGPNHALSSIAVNSDRELVVMDNAVTVATLDLTTPPYDTAGEVATAIQGVTNFSATLVDGVSSDLQSTLFVEATHLANDAEEPNFITYTNEASGTNAALIDQLILEVDAAIGRYCGRYDETTGTQTFQSATRTEKYDGSGSGIIVLRNSPVTSITSVKHIDTNGSETTLASTSYRVDTRTGILRRLSGFDTGDDWHGDSSSDGPRRRQRTGSVWKGGFQNYEVVYVAGYGTVPADLQGVATDLVADAFFDRREHGGMSQVAMGGTTKQYRPIAELVELRAMRLAPYVRGGSQFS